MLKKGSKCKNCLTITVKSGDIVSDIENGSINSDEISVYPNPAQEYIMLKTDLKTANIRILDLSGKIVYSNVYKGNQQQFNVSDLNKGLYLIEVLSKGNRVVKRFVKE